MQAIIDLEWRGVKYDFLISQVPDMKRKKLNTLQTEMELLINLLKDLKKMNDLEPIDFGFVECVFWEYISGREIEIQRELKTIYD